MKTKTYEKNGNGSTNGYRTSPPINNDPITIKPIPDPDPAKRSATVAKCSQQIYHANARALLAGQFKELSVRKEHVAAELTTVKEALSKGVWDGLVDESSPLLPTSFGGWATLSVCCLGIVGIEASTILNAVTYATPLTQSPLGAVAMATPILAVPFMVKSFMPPFHWARATLGALGLVASVVFAIFFALLFGTGLGDGGVRMLTSQLCAEAFLLAAVSAAIAATVHRPVPEKVRRLQKDLENDLARLDGKCSELETKIRAFDASETAAYDKAMLLFAAEEEELNILKRQAAIANNFVPTLNFNPQF